jgi:D-3-phosphoglycerate dehydrogenase
MNVLIADKFPEQGIKDLEALGCKVTLNPQLGRDDLVEAAKDAHIIIVRSTEVRQPAIDAAKNLTLVIRAGAGYDTIDVGRAAERGIYVANCPGKNSIAVAELAIALILAIDRRIPDCVAELRAGKWNKKEYSKADGLFGKAIGIVGLGGIGREVLKRAIGIGLKPIGWSRSLTPERADELGIRRCATLEELAAASDIVTVHLARTPETQHVIGKRFFAAMKPKAIFIHTARGGVVDEAALLDAVKTKGIRAGLDVYEKEPKPATADFADPLLAEPTVYGTHHIGASTNQAQDAIAAEAVRIVRSFIETGSVPNCVNLETKSPARWQLVVRHYDKVGVLANVLSTLKERAINVEEMENIIFAGAKAACAKIKLDSQPDDAVLAQIRGRTDEIIHADLVEIG